MQRLQLSVVAIVTKRLVVAAGVDQDDGLSEGLKQADKNRCVRDNKAIKLSQEGAIALHESIHHVLVKPVPRKDIYDRAVAGLPSLLRNSLLGADDLMERAWWCAYGSFSM